MTSHALRVSILVVCASSALAQRRTGIVVDESGAPVPDAAVSGPCAGKVNATDEEGRFELPPSGRCRVRIAAPGFEPVEVEARTNQSFRVTLKLSVHREDVQVTAQAALEVSSIPIARAELDALPSLGTDVLAPLVELLDGSSLGEEGPTVVIDGLETPAAKVPAGAIQEVRLFENPYSAEFRRPGRGRIEITTKQSAQQLHGDVRALLRDSRLDARNAFAATRPPEQRRAYEGSVTGPWGAGRSFLVAFEREEGDLQALVFARTPSGDVRRNFATPGRSFEITAGASFVHGERGFSSLRYQAERQSEENQGIGGFRLPESGYNERERDHEVRYSYRTALSPQLTTGFRTRIEIEQSRGESLEPGKPAEEIQDAFTGGGAQVDRNAAQVGFQGAADIAWAGRTHQVKAGFDAPEISRLSGDDRSGFEGAYSFASLDDYLANRPFAFVQNRGESDWRVSQREFGLYLQDDMRVHARLQLGAGFRFDRQAAVRDRNNCAPRVSAAFGVDGNRRLVLRAGAGVFYGQLPSSGIEDAARFDGRRVYQVIETPGNAGEALPAAVTRLDPRLRSPYALHANTTLEYRAAKSTVLSLSWLTARGLKQLRTRDINAPPHGSLLRPDPSATMVRQIESSAQLKSHALEVSLRGAIARFKGTLRYTLARALNDSAGSRSLPADSHDLRPEWGRADFDRRHRVQLLGSLPSIGGFVLGLSAELSSGRPYSVTTGTDDNHDGRAADRPAGERRNSRQGPGAARMDVRLSKAFPLAADRKGRTATLAIDAINLTNRVNYGNPVGNLRSPFFGVPVSAGPARRLQASVRFQF